MPGCKKPISTLVIYKWRSPVCQFVRAKQSTNIWRMPIPHVLRDVSCGYVTMLRQKRSYLATIAQSASDNCFYPVLCPKLTLIQPTWSAYPYHLVFLIWYPYSLVFLIWYPYALTSLYGNTAHCSGCGVAMGCYGLSIVPRTAIVTSQWYDRYCFAGYARTWARHPTTPWQRERTTITDFQSIDSL